MRVTCLAQEKQHNDPGPCTKRKSTYCQYFMQHLNELNFISLKMTLLWERRLKCKQNKALGNITLNSVGEMKYKAIFQDAKQQQLLIQTEFPGKFFTSKSTLVYTIFCSVLNLFVNITVVHFNCYFCFPLPVHGCSMAKTTDT